MHVKGAGGQTALLWATYNAIRTNKQPGYEYMPALENHTLMVCALEDTRADDGHIGIGCSDPNNGEQSWQHTRHLRRDREKKKRTVLVHWPEMGDL